MADDILKNIPLPADLPENWTSDQIVAPTGAEAGLDNQHGYNYLMKQVNNAQKALKVLVAQREEDLAKIKFWVSPDPTSPAELFGGTWERIKDCFILAAGDTYAAGSTGGEAKHTLTQKEMPSHNHMMLVSGYTGWGEGTVNGYVLKLDNNILENTTGAQTTLPHVTGNNLNILDSGGSSAHNNMPPYVAMYVWKRIA